jgi:hypothetical protein
MAAVSSEIDMAGNGRDCQNSLAEEATQMAALA